MAEFLFGKSPIREVLRAGRRIVHKIFYQSMTIDPILQEILHLSQKRNIPLQIVSKDWFKNHFRDSQVTQSIAAQVQEYPYQDWDTLLSVTKSSTSLLLALDHVQDPQNLGAILRSAECSGVDGVLLPTDRSAHVTPIVCKSSAGAVEYLSVIKVVNLAQSISKLKQVGFWVVGTIAPDRSEHLPVSQVEDALSFSWPKKTVLILGGEEKGMRRLTREHCDFLIHLPMLGHISSLNVSATAATLFYLYIKNVREEKP